MTPVVCSAPAALKDLEDLLLSLLEVGELRLFVVHGPQGREILECLPGDQTPPRLQAHALVDELLARGLLGGAFFARLCDERPRRRREIEAVAALFLTGGSPGRVMFRADLGPSHHGVIHALLADLLTSPPAVARFRAALQPLGLALHPGPEAATRWYALLHQAQFQSLLPDLLAAAWVLAPDDPRFASLLSKEKTP